MWANLKYLTNAQRWTAMTFSMSREIEITSPVPYSMSKRAMIGPRVSTFSRQFTKPVKQQMHWVPKTAHVPRLGEK
jgi:hypothetical protein